MSSRNKYSDHLRGVAIIMVVEIHTMPEIKGYSSLIDIVSFPVRQLLNCAVTLFLAISNFSLQKKIYQIGKTIFYF